MSVILSARGIEKAFRSGMNTVKVLKGIDVDISEGTLTVFKGRSGSGKTTLMNILGTLDLPTVGEVTIGKSSVANISEAARDELRRKKLSFVFQSVALIGTMTAYENVEFMLRIAGLPLDKKRIEYCLSLVGLSERMNHMPVQLSGGEQQRVAIARAIVHKPRIIFADEPTAQLDSKTSLQVMKIFRYLIQNEGMTVVMTTHDTNMMALADHVYTLDDGAVVGESFPVKKEGM